MIYKCQIDHDLFFHEIPKQIWSITSVCLPFTPQNFLPFESIMCFDPPFPPNLAVYIPVLVTNWTASTLAPDHTWIFDMNWPGGHSMLKSAPPCPPTTGVVWNCPVWGSTNRNCSWSTSAPAFPLTPIRANFWLTNSKGLPELPPQICPHPSAPSWWLRLCYSLCRKSVAFWNMLMMILFYIQH